MSTTSNNAQRLLAQRGWRLRNSTWMLIPLLTCGVGSGPTFIVIGARAHRRDWWLPGVGYCVLVVLWIVLNAISAADSALNTGASLLLGAIWAGGLVHGLLINRAWLRWRSENDVAPSYPLNPTPGSAPGAPWPGGVGGPAGSRPRSGPPPVAPWAQGAGAPPPRWAQDARTGGPPPRPYVSLPPPTWPAPPPPVPRSMDVNTAGIGELAGLPAFDYERAGRVVTARGRQNGFHTVEDFHRAAGLSPYEIARVRDHVRCSPPRR